MLQASLIGLQNRDFPVSHYTEVLSTCNGKASLKERTELDRGATLFSFEYHGNHINSFLPTKCQPRPATSLILVLQHIQAHHKGRGCRRSFAAASTSRAWMYDRGFGGADSKLQGKFNCLSPVQSAVGSRSTIWQHKSRP